MGSDAMQTKKGSPPSTSEGLSDAFPKRPSLIYFLWAAVYANVCVGAFHWIGSGSGNEFRRAVWESLAFMELPLFGCMTLAAVAWRWLDCGEKKAAFLMLAVPGAFCAMRAWVGTMTGSPYDLTKLALGCVICCIGFMLLTSWWLRRGSRDLAQAKMQALQSRIRPHFVFNTINAILVMIRKNPTQAENALLDFADLFHAMMKQSSELVPFKAELDLAQKYMGLEALRFGARLSFSESVDPNCLLAELPPLTLQPLLENAVVHGLEQSESGNIAMRAFVSGGRLTVIVENPAPKAPGESKGNGIAVENIRDRLALRFGPEAKMSQSIKDGVWTTRISVPARES